MNLGLSVAQKGRHIGRFERAEKGTLFLDELATAPIQVQEKLLRVIEYDEYERVGGTQVLTSNVRLICATNQDLQQMTAEGNFRADLLDRLSFDVIHVPPLRHRESKMFYSSQPTLLKKCVPKLDLSNSTDSHKKLKNV